MRQCWSLQLYFSTLIFSDDIFAGKPVLCFIVFQQWKTWCIFHIYLFLKEPIQVEMFLIGVVGVVVVGVSWCVRVPCRPPRLFDKQQCFQHNVGNTTMILQISQTRVVRTDLGVLLNPISWWVLWPGRLPPPDLRSSPSDRSLRHLGYGKHTWHFYNEGRRCS